MSSTETTARRGALYVYWGTKVEAELERSVRSLRRFHPDLPVEKVKLPDDSSLLDKGKIFDYSPFETTVFLDTDTVVLDHLDFGFEMAERHGLACCINECPWARRYRDIGGDQLEYNTGVLFFNHAAQPVFDRWKALAHEIDSSIVFHGSHGPTVMPHNDQAGFSQALVDTGFNPFVLPLNWNLRPIWHHSFFGPIKIWHDHADPPPIVHQWNETQESEASIIRFSGNFEKTLLPRK